MTIRTCSVEEARQRLDKGCCLVDVREYPEYVEGNLGGKLIPLGRLLLHPELVGSEDEVLLLCRGGKRAQQAAEALAKHGGVQPVVIEGGIEAWKQAGFPVRKEKGPISLERQVRIAAGILVLTGLALDGVLPGARFLSAFVGAGLVFAGVTDTCAMGLLLAKLPWNQVRQGSEVA